MYSMNILEEAIIMKENIKLDENKKENKKENKGKQIKYQLQEFNKSEEEKFKILNEMLKKMENLNRKLFFKQLGQFLGGLYSIALNREKLTGLKGFREKLKSSNRGVKGVKTHINEFLKISSGTEKSFYYLRSLIEFLKGEVARSNSALNKLDNKIFKEICHGKALEEFGYKTLVLSQISMLNDLRTQGRFESMFKWGWEPFPKDEKLKTLELLNNNYVSNYQNNCLEMTKVVKRSVLQSIRNPNLKFYNPDFKEQEKDKKQEKRKNVEDDPETFGSYGETISQLMAELNGNLRTIADLNTEQANSRNTYIPFGKFLGRLYYVCEKSRGWKSIFSSSKKGASGAVTYIKKFLNTQGGSEKCATALDDLMEFLLGNNGIRLSSSRLYTIGESSLKTSWEKIEKVVINSIDKNEFKEKLLENFNKLKDDKLLKELIDIYINQTTSDDNWKNAYGSGYNHSDEYLVFYRKNFLAPAKIKMAKIVQRECLTTYNKIKIENK